MSEMEEHRNLGKQFPTGCAMMWYRLGGGESKLEKTHTVEDRGHIDGPG